MKRLTLPPQPDESSWKFIEELREPEPSLFRWTYREPLQNEVDLQKGVILDWDLADPEGLLETAYQDLRRFLRLAGVRLKKGYPVRFRLEESLGKETFEISIAKEACTIQAGDLEGMRRAIYGFEEQLKKAKAPCLEIGEVRRSAVIDTRISRCFFGPIKRPPKNRDELTDDVDYYPDAYLSRLAREGVNGLWLTAKFHELCPSRFFPEFGKDSERRLQKLRETVHKCRRYGIGVYVFCIEPQAFGNIPQFLHPPHHLEKFPELAGHKEGAFTFFCTSTKTGQDYLEEATHSLFSNVPHLAGLINISMGETPTHCYSNLLWDTRANKCPRCSKRKPWEVFRDTLSAMKHGMHQANPQAKLISWLYVPTVIERPERPAETFLKEIEEIATHFPEDVIFQYNFESMGAEQQLGEQRIVHDYSLAYVGPSEIFANCAQKAVSNEKTVSAKLQVGCSHEVATIPYVPAPGNLFRKYQAMHQLGVRAAMQCWYFGNYPSLMTRAAGRLSFAPFPASEKEFFLELATPWGDDAPLVAEAWEHFSAAYREFPANLYATWYSPTHDSVTWPLYIRPVDRGIAPSWRSGFPPSGDRIGECIGYGHTLEEILTLSERVTTQWDQGLEVLKKINQRRLEHSLKREIGVAKALGIQFNSAFNVLKFYALREELFDMDPAATEQRMTHYRQIKELLFKEIDNSRDLIALCEKDSRLGFHSEVEGYKYFPDLLRWRIDRLFKTALQDGMDIIGKLRSNRPLFPQYTGARKSGKRYACQNVSSSSREDWENIPWENCEAPDGWETRWQVAQKDHSLVFKIQCAVPESIMQKWSETDVLSGDHVTVLVEPRRLWPAKTFIVGVWGDRYDNGIRLPDDPWWKSEVHRTPTGWTVQLEVPLDLFKCSGIRKHIRVNIIRKTHETPPISWIPLNPLPPRLLFKDYNPKDMGWLDFGVR